GRLRGGCAGGERGGAPLRPARRVTSRLQVRPLWPAYLATFTFTLGQWASGVAIPLHVQSLGGSLTEAGTIAAIRFGLGAIFSLPFGAVADAWGTRRTVFVAVIGSAMVNLIPLLAQATRTTAPLYGWAILSGLTSSLVLPAIGAYVAGSADERRRGSDLGWMTCGWARCIEFGLEGGEHCRRLVDMSAAIFL